MAMASFTSGEDFAGSDVSQTTFVPWRTLIVSDSFHITKPHSRNRVLFSSTHSTMALSGR